MEPPNGRFQSKHQRFVDSLKAKTLLDLPNLSSINYRNKNGKLNTTGNELPVELWREIFLIATGIRVYQDFCSDAEVNNSMTCDTQSNETIPHPSKRDERLSSMSTIVLVCKYWYLIGMPLLWSHLRLNLPATTTYFESICNKLISLSDITSNVTRLDVLIPSTAKYGQYQWSEKILTLLPALKMVTCPITFGGSINDIYNHQPDILVLTRAHSAPNSLLVVPSFWHGVRVMSIEFHSEYSSIITPKAVTFPNLEILCIKDRGGSMGGSIIANWVTPCLRNLSIESNNHYLAWIVLLIKIGHQLHKLELNAIFDEGIPLFMPQLRVLYLADDTYFRKWVKQIIAPHLYRFGIFNIKPPWRANDRGRQVDNALDLFPTLNELSIRAEDVSGSRERVYIPMTDLEVWKRRGIMVDIPAKLVEGKR